MLVGRVQSAPLAAITWRGSGAASLIASVCSSVADGWLRVMVSVCASGAVTPSFSGASAPVFTARALTIG